MSAAGISVCGVGFFVRQREKEVPLKRSGHNRPSIRSRDVTVLTLDDNLFKGDVVSL